MSSDNKTSHSSTPKLGESPLAEIIHALTLPEKISLVRGVGMDLSALDPDSEGPVVGNTEESRVPGAAGETNAVERLGIPSIVMADGPAGIRIAPFRDSAPGRSFHATAFPIATLLASSWDLDLVEQVGNAMGHEAKEYGVDVLLAPGVNIQRYPLGGRNFEYYSEDSVLAGQMAGAFIQGVQAMGVGTSIKHYVANNHEWNRDTIDVQMDVEVLREIYLRTFEVAIKQSQPWTVMSSYNKVNGEYTSESDWLLTDVLREQWGYDGVVVTDWFGGRNPIQQMLAGNDLLMPGMDEQEQALLAAVQGGMLDESVLDQNIERILKLIMKTLTFQKYAYSDQPDLAANALIARRAASEGMVLLENREQTLPLAAAAKVAVFGSYSAQMGSGGTGSGDVHKAYSVSLGEGLENVGLHSDAELFKRYAVFLDEYHASLPPLEGLQAFLAQPPLPELAFTEEQLDDLAQRNDLAILTIGRSSGEFVDRNPQDFYLRDEERELLSAVRKAFARQGKPLVVILNIGGPIEMASWREQADAILLAWQPGQEAGNAIADILAGEINPSGRLTSSFVNRLDDFPQAQGFPGVVTDPDAAPEGLMNSFPASIHYTDGLDVGYRYFAGSPNVTYPFGYGLSYTEFDCSDLKIENELPHSQLSVSLTMTNTAAVAGREVVQLYVQGPSGNNSSGPILRAFHKTQLLEPGKSEVISFTLPARELGSFDKVSDGWLLAEGEYKISIARNCDDVVQTANVDVAASRIWSP